MINEITKAIEEEGGIDSGIGFDIKLLKGNISSADKQKNVRTEKIELYHELLNEIETKLFDKKVLNDLNIDSSNKSYNDFLLNVPNYKYIKANGWSSFEDFERFKKIMSNINEIQRLVYGSGLENEPQIQILKKEINDLKRSLSKGNNPKELAKLKAIEKKFDQTLQKASDANLLDETFIERVKIFLDTLSPERLNFRLAPLDLFPEFQIIANLKSQYLLEGDFENVIYKYGSRPNIKLTVFGIITSCPGATDQRVNLNDEFNNYDETETNEAMIYEKAFRHVFSTFEGLEKFFFVPTYPKIAISPIGIYREVFFE